MQKINAFRKSIFAKLFNISKVTVKDNNNNNNNDNNDNNDINNKNKNNNDNEKEIKAIKIVQLQSDEEGNMYYIDEELKTRIYIPFELFKVERESILPRKSILPTF